MKKFYGHTNLIMPHKIGQSCTLFSKVLVCQSFHDPECSVHACSPSLQVWSQSPLMRAVEGSGACTPKISSRVPTRYWKYWKTTELWNRFTRPGKSIEYSIMQNVNKLLKSMEIPHSAICFFKFRSLPLMTVLQMFFALCSMNKLLEKMKISGGIKVFHLVLK